MTDTDIMNTPVASWISRDDDDWNVLPASPVDRQLMMDSAENVGFVVNGLSLDWASGPHQTVKISTH